MDGEGWRRKPPSHKGETFPIEVLTPDDVAKLVGACSTKSTSGVRMAAMIGVMYGAGLRISEMLALCPRDLDLNSGTLRVRDGKGGRARTVGIDPYACGLVARWMDRRATYGMNGQHPVFATYTQGKVGEPLIDRTVGTMLKRVAERAGITKRVHPHGLRHSLASDMAVNGVPVHAIQAQLGHTSLQWTARS